MKNKEVLILFSCDSHHTEESKRLIAVFSDQENINDFLEESDPEELNLNHILTKDQKWELLEQGQTQGLETNLLVLTERLNPSKYL